MMKENAVCERMEEEEEKKEEEEEEEEKEGEATSSCHDEKLPEYFTSQNVIEAKTMFS